MAVCLLHLKLCRGGGGEKNHSITIFSYPPPLGGVQPEKKYPTPMCKRVSQPQFFSKEHHWLLFHNCVSVAYIML